MCDGFSGGVAELKRRHGFLTGPGSADHKQHGHSSTKTVAPLALLLRAGVGGLKALSGVWGRAPRCGACFCFCISG
jgi:hypothetical protein